jgi:twitching motility protein PilT
VGELTDSESVLAALRAAETGHLVISTVHAPDTNQAIERIVNLFPPEHASSVCQQLSSCLLAVLFQLLIPVRGGKRILATELLIANPAVKNMIREKKFSQIRLSIQTGREQGMYTLDARLRELYDKGMIEREALEEYIKQKDF